MLNDTMELLKMQMEERDYKKSEKKNKYAALVQQSMLEEKEIRQMQSKIKEDKAQLQKNYAKALEAQMAVKRPAAIEVGNKRAEDASNKLESSPKGMVPGIFNIDSVGSRAIYRTGVMIAKSPSIGMSSKYMEEVRKLEGKKKIERQSDQNVVPNKNSEKYNTITNPIPMATSNPYLIKQLSKAVKM
jgi:hypothetical protein